MKRTTINPYNSSVFFIVAVLWSLFLGGCSSKSSASSGEEATPTPIPTPVIPTKPSYKVTRGEVINKFDFTGRVVPVVEQELFFRVGGRVNKVFVKNGEKVQKDQLLSQLEGIRDFDIRRAEADLEIAKLNLELARVELVKWSPDYSIRIAIQEKEVELAQLALDEVKSNVADMRIIAPFDGTVLSIMLSEGSGVDAFRPVLIVADLTNLEISGDVSSQDMAKLAEGMAVSVKPIGRPGEALDGIIRRLPYPYGTSKASTTSDSSGNSTVDQSVRITLSKSLVDAQYTLGDLAQVTVVLEDKKDVLWLPPQAIRNFEGRKFVIVQDGEGQRRVDVKVGITSDDRVEILDGLQEGQVVIAP